MKLLILLNLFLITSQWKMVPLKKNRNYNLLTKNKFIAIDHAGIEGFYTLGICSFIKNNYNISEYKYIGTSMGTWTALIMSSKFSIKEIVSKYINYINFSKINTISSFNYCFQDFFLENYNIDDFDIERLNICITQLDSINFESNIINKFKSFEQILDCCIISSKLNHIIDDNLLNKYDDWSDYSQFPPNNIYCHINIKSNIFDNDIYSTLFLKNLKNQTTATILANLFNKGIYDSSCNKETLDYIFNNNGYVNYKDNERFFLDSNFEILF